MYAKIKYNMTNKIIQYYNLEYKFNKNNNLNTNLN